MNSNRDLVCPLPSSLKFPCEPLCLFPAVEKIMAIGYFVLSTLLCTYWAVYSCFIKRADFEIH